MSIELLDMISSIGTCISAVAGIVVYFRTEYKEKRTRTENAIETLYEAHDKLSTKNIKKDYMDFVRFTRHANRFACMYNEKQFNKTIVKNKIGSLLVRIYDEKLSDIVAQQRKQFKRDEYFSQLEDMINDLKKP